MMFSDQSELLTPQAREPRGGRTEGEGGAKGSSLGSNYSPNKIIGEQLVHPAPPIFSVTYSYK